MMRNRLFVTHCLIWLLVLTFLCLTGCSDEPTKNRAPATVKKTRPPVKKEEVKQVEEIIEEAPKGFVYSPTGRRDPFEPLVKKGDKKKSNNIPLTPLQRFDLGQFRLQAVLIGKGEPHAMVGAPDGKTYILTPGIKIGKRDGVVTQITRESVRRRSRGQDVAATFRGNGGRPVGARSERLGCARGTEGEAERRAAQDVGSPQ